MSFDPVSLFTNLPLEDTVNIILRKTYETKEIVTDNLNLKRMKNVLLTFNAV